MCLAGRNDSSRMLLILWVPYRGYYGMRAVLIPLLVANVGCFDRTPVRIAAASDTVTVNTTMLEPIEARVVNRKGAVIRGAAIEYSSTAPDSILTVRDGRAIQCRNDGLAPVTLTSGRITSIVTVRCEIIERLEAEPFVCMRLGDPPVPMSVTALDKTGHVVSTPRIYLYTDSSFLKVKDGMVSPLKAGDGDLWFTNGRRRAITLVRVLDTASVANSKVRVIHARDRMLAPVCAQSGARPSVN